MDKEDVEHEEKLALFNLILSVTTSKVLHKSYIRKHLGISKEVYNLLDSCEVGVFSLHYLRLLRRSAEELLSVISELRAYEKESE